MNVHDSERIAGLLDEAGNAPVADAAQPDVVVFSTCAVRENADNKLHGNLGHLKPVKDRTPGMPPLDRIVVVCRSACDTRRPCQFLDSRHGDVLARPMFEKGECGHWRVPRRLEFDTVWDRLADSIDKRPVTSSCRSTGSWRSA